MEKVYKQELIIIFAQNNICKEKDTLFELEAWWKQVKAPYNAWKGITHNSKLRLFIIVDWDEHLDSLLHLSYPQDSFIKQNKLIILLIKR